MIIPDSSREKHQGIIEVNPSVTVNIGCCPEPFHSADGMFHGRAETADKAVIFFLLVSQLSSFCVFLWDLGIGMGFGKSGKSRIYPSGNLSRKIFNSRFIKKPFIVPSARSGRSQVQNFLLLIGHDDVFSGRGFPLPAVEFVLLLGILWSLYSSVSTVNKDIFNLREKN